MALTREERKLLHQKSKEPTFGSGKPDSSQGFEGDLSYRKISGSGTVQYIKQSHEWIPMSSSGTMPPLRIGSGGGGRTSSGDGGGISSHTLLDDLDVDTHLQYLLIDGTRAMTGDLSLGGGDGALTFTVAGENSIKIPDNQASALIIEEANTAYLTFVTTNSGEKITLGKKLEAGSVEIEGTAFDINGGAIDGTTIGVASHTTIKGTTIDATTDFTIDGLVITADTISNDANLTINVAADIILDAAGKDISLTDGSGTAEFIFNLEAAPELDVDGAFTIDGSSTIRLDSVSTMDFYVNGRELLKFDTNGHSYLHAYDLTLYNDYKLNIKNGTYLFTGGTADYRENYSILTKHIESSSFNTSYGSTQ